jgi:hypothetical protein
MRSASSSNCAGRDGSASTTAIDVAIGRPPTHVLVKISIDVPRDPIERHHHRPPTNTASRRSRIVASRLFLDPRISDTAARRARAATATETYRAKGRRRRRSRVRPTPIRRDLGVRLGTDRRLGLRSLMSSGAFSAERGRRSAPS